MSDISDGKNDNLFYSVSRPEIGLDPAFLFVVTNILDYRITGFTGLRLNSQRSKIQGLDQRYLNPRTDHGFRSPDPRFLLAFHKRWSKVQNFWFGGFFPPRFLLGFCWV